MLWNNKNMVSYKEQIKSRSLNDYLEDTTGLEELLRKRLLSAEEKKVLKIYLSNPQGLNDHQASILTGLTVDGIRNHRESIDKKTGTHLIINNKNNLWIINKHHNYN